MNVFSKQQNIFQKIIFYFFYRGNNIPLWTRYLSRNGRVYSSIKWKLYKISAVDHMTKVIGRIECFPISEHILMTKVDIVRGMNEYFWLEAIKHNQFIKQNMPFLSIKAYIKHIYVSNESSQIGYSCRVYDNMAPI